ncbi:23S rRNA (guanosine2251-2'-O)-methyltransferase [Spiroplasma chinense]|uniref:23S rRNA (Guanosine2251-2'-O)-methyltransferase n=1 Tax=Spiroplasma chinense TaxID=216932 RepID=A0A5B9Y2R8_9MOLU|nr:23S rRNA (guanosine(2251)-2'-O)-methyltransferase RlmB [Spiroplasma chinense]QEH61231.1 23S rRNA (guanosine2251-2'-O)-methyltransferase [Spiroplasma chinense]
MKNFIYGKKPVQNTIVNFTNLIKHIYVLKGFSFDRDVYKVIKEKNISWSSLDKEKFNNLIHEKVNHQGIIADMKEYNYRSMKDIIGNEQEQTILVLDRIQDPNNFGSIIRSAVLFGVKGIVILDHNQVDVTPAVIKSSAGTIYNIPIVKVSNLSNAINMLKEKGYWIYCSYLSDTSTDIRNIKFDKKSVIIMGSEGDGVMKKIANQSDFCFSIPTNKAIDSLNVSVAAGIILFTKNLSA